MKHFFFILVAVILFVSQSFAQPTIHDDRITLRSVTNLPANTVRIKYNASNETLYFSTIGGDIYSVNIETGSQSQLSFTEPHNLQEVQGFDISNDGKFYIVGNIKDGIDFTNTATIMRGILDGTTITWEKVAETEPYPLSNTFFDHIMNGIVVSADNSTLYINSGSRTDHGEVHSVDGRYPELRETSLTAKILRIPADATDLFLPDNIDSLNANGYIFAEGIRNTFSLAFDKDGNLFGPDNAGERDDPGEFNWIQEGNHYGFPWRVGGNDTPMQFDGYDPDADIMLQPETNGYQFGFFYNDPDYPEPPEGVTFTEPLLNYGPDGVMYRNPDTDTILNAFEQDTAISSFTAHRSMLGLVFDTESALGAEFTNDGFTLAFSDDNFFIRWMDDPGEDLLHIELTEVDGTYEMTSTRIASDFISPIDAEIIGNKVYVAEYRNDSWLNVGANTRIWELTFPVNTTNTETELESPSNFTLHQNYPNPFNPTTTLSFDLKVPGFVELTVSDLTGREVQTLVNRAMAAETHSLRFDASNLSSGVYLYSLRVDDVLISTQKMVLVK
ncbi:MAG: T9SS C-terminal target domain-containing protein [Balneola sp.]|nr:MAG: T9SS C-terminal target domain-containing protein [Balneola sp.]